MNKITIAICTYNRGEIISEALQSLLNQTVPSSEFVLLIIDNNSTDNTEDILKDFSKKFASFRIIHESKQGLSHARNRALMECTTDWLAFLDDDAKAHPDWINTILETISCNDFDAFGGPYYAWHRYGPAPSWLPKEFGTYESPQPYGLLTGNSYIPGGNCVINCIAAKTTGMFSTELGMNGGKCSYGEETQFFKRMGELGYRLGYVPQLKIDHCVLPYKYKMRWQLRSAFEHGKANAHTSTSIKKLLITRFLWHTCRTVIRIIKEVIHNPSKNSSSYILIKNIRPLFFDAGLLIEHYSSFKRGKK